MFEKIIFIILPIVSLYSAIRMEYRIYTGKFKVDTHQKKLLRVSGWILPIVALIYAISIY